MNEIGVHYDHQADRRDSYIARNDYYYRLLFNHYRNLIPQGKNVLEIGCGTGSLWQRFNLNMAQASISVKK